MRINRQCPTHLCQCGECIWNFWRLFDSSGTPQSVMKTVLITTGMVMNAIFKKQSTFPLEETFTLEIYAWHFSCKRFISYNFNWLANVSNCFRKEEGCMLDRIMDEKLMRMLSETSFIYVRNKRKLNTPSHIKSLRIEYERRNYRRFSVGSFVRTEI